MLQMIDQLGGGGAERVVVEIAAHLPEEYEPLVCATRHTGNFAYLDLLRQREIPFALIGRKSRYDVDGLARLKRLVDAFRPDIVHTHKFGSNVWGRLLRLTSKIPVVICHEHTWSYDSPARLRVLINKLLAPLSDAIIAVSEADRRKLMTLERLPAEKIVVVYNGIDFSRVDSHVPRSVFRERLGLGQDTFTAAVIGKLEVQKGHELLLQAMTQLVGVMPGFTVLIAGEGSLRERLEAQASTLGLGPNLRFLGFVSDIGSLLHGVDLVLMPSLFEGHPIALLEAMAAGRLVIASEVGGVSEVVRHGQNGILVPPNQVQPLVSSIVQAFSSETMRTRIGIAAARDVRQRFSIEAAVRKYVEIYQKLLAEKTSVQYRFRRPLGGGPRKTR